MNALARNAEALSLLVFIIASTSAMAQNQDLVQAAHSQNQTPQIVRSMTGTWIVRQRMWAGAGAEATELPSAIAHRRLIGAILEERMELAPQATGEQFTRVAYFEYNVINRQYEYFSIDSRPPQMMRESSCENIPQSKINNPESNSLCRGTFVAPDWGKAKNVAFRYRLVIGPPADDKQIVSLYLTPLSSDKSDEFLAFEYVYSRQP